LTQPPAIREQDVEKGLMARERSKHEVFDLSLLRLIWDKNGIHGMARAVKEPV
jgi:hypothetical protein